MMGFWMIYHLGGHSLECKRFKGSEDPVTLACDGTWQQILDTGGGNLMGKLLRNLVELSLVVVGGLLRTCLQEGGAY